MGELSDKEQDLLDKILNEDTKLRLKYTSLLQSEEFVERYNIFSSINKDIAIAKFKREHSIHKSKPIRYYISYAAAIVIIIITSVVFYNLQNKIITPTLSKDISQAIYKAQSAGKNKALLVISGKEITNVCSDSAVHAITKNRSNAKSTLITRNDKEFWLTLEDGTCVHLNYNTRLSYPIKFSENNRTVSLDGEAYFFVAKDSKRPFYVKTDNGIVKEYGTHFDVNTRSTPGSTEVVLIEGSISVFTQKGKEQIIRPGQKAMLQKASEKVNVENVDVNPYKAWNEGRFVFENYPLSKLMDVLSRWYGRKVIFKNKNECLVHFTGTLDRYGELGELLKAIENVTDVKITDDGQTIEID
jgi:ferric-dicitrate binding protein FerR (iron transport regulator)